MTKSDNVIPLRKAESPEAAIKRLYAALPRTEDIQWDGPAKDALLLYLDGLPDEQRKVVADASGDPRLHFLWEMERGVS